MAKRKKKKIIRKTTRTKKKKSFLRKNSTIVVLIILFSILMVATYLNNRVEILYFRSDSCGVVGITDEIMKDLKETFGINIDVRTMNVKFSAKDPEDTDEIKALREKYNVIGLPDIIINGEKFRKSFSRDNIFNEICNNFIFKPGVCL